MSNLTSKEQPVFDLSKINYTGFWKMLWIKIVGKKFIYTDVTYKNTYYYHEGIYYFSDMEEHNIFTINGED